MHLAIRFVVEYSNRFNEINPRSYPVLADIALKATKAWIHNELIVEMHTQEGKHQDTQKQSSNSET